MLVLVLVLMRVVRARHGAALAVHPARIAVDVVFLLPDGHAMFDFIDDEAAGAERFVAMRGAHAHPHGDVAERQRAHAMHAGGARDAELRDGFLDDARAFLFGELGEGFVFEARDRVAFVVIAHPAFEGRKTAAASRRASRAAAPRYRAARVLKRNGASSAGHRGNEHHGIAGLQAAATSRRTRH